MTRLMTWSPLCPVFFGLMMVPQSTETDNITLNNLTLFGPNSVFPKVPIRLQDL